MRITLQLLLDLQRQAVHAFAHVGAADRQPHPYPARNRDHRRANASTTAAAKAGDTDAGIRTRGTVKLRRSSQNTGVRRIWLMDHGVPTEEVLAEMRVADPPVHYLVGTPRGRLTRLEKHLKSEQWMSRARWWNDDKNPVFSHGESGVCCRYEAGDYKQ